jgi:ketosteroid isomerase-like protein
MSQENVEIVRSAAAAFNRGDLDAWFGYLADDIDHRAVEGAPDDPARFTARTPCVRTSRTGSARSTTSRASQPS